MRHLLNYKGLFFALLLALCGMGGQVIPARAGSFPGGLGTFPEKPQGFFPFPGAESDTLPATPSRAERKRQAMGEGETAVGDSLQEQNERNLEQLDRPIEGDSLYFLSRAAEEKLDSAATALLKQKKPFVPDSRRATWLAAIFPGAGQIYNRKFWKLPIIYGGFLGCAYALSWNTKYYDDYSQAYLDIMDDDSTTDSYLDFLPINYQVEGREEWLQSVFRNKRNAFRRQRDLSIFAFIGVYIISIIDAYVDAELSRFDITPDISFHINPAVNLDQKSNNHSIGLQCSVNF